ncbi:class Ib ribonucleoside-diphosphate reductase assembly flavoprotein NrdI [Thermoactinomyces sp. DSM 45892]|uniref:class Ib ribonucleoside-diphosphate reductase assembly flavoprotein NrdI n=1 Tax=Thermoactinomyces sp. DSM 45892 TaxID=1882753 RepID=UPI00089B417A|nr:class Ib ribonucleoside-diphosphate reductase assembly flavoprotein NrdI [Thermoactinomyces sp. DSM 45892]SDX93596.1 protein involved in ribonucleotide reduction [Thermoactinomyces sp. DSM 45892]
MLVLFDSLTGNVERFVKQLGMRAMKIEEGLIIEEPFVLVTYTCGRGDVPSTTMKFLLRGNFINLRGVASSGNRNWIPLFAMAGERIASQFGVPLLGKFELSGTKKDIEEIKNRIIELDNNS